MYTSCSASLPSSYSFQYACCCGGSTGSTCTLAVRDLARGVLASLAMGVYARTLVIRSCCLDRRRLKSRRVKLLGLFKTSLLNRSPRDRDPVHFYQHSVSFCTGDWAVLRTLYFFKILRNAVRWAATNVCNDLMSSPHLVIVSSVRVKPPRSATHFVIWLSYLANFSRLFRDIGLPLLYSHRARNRRKSL